MFKDSKNKGKLISFIIAFSLIILTTLFVNENQMKMERISGQIAVLDKNMEAGLSNYLSAKSEFSQAIMYQTLGMMHVENGHSFKTLYLPFKDAVINSINNVNISIGYGETKLTDKQIQSISNAFTTAASNNNSYSFINVSMSSLKILKQLNSAYEATVLKQADKKLELKKARSAFETRASVLTWIAAIIAFLQLFFTSFYEMYLEYKKTSIRKT
jgi:hypothetical protein